MCGINGFNFRNEELIRKQSQATKHRGPDDEGLYLDEDISLAHNRLAIIDLSETGHQPMENDKGNLVIVYNGELYNFEKIREDLILAGIKFRSKSDTEVILKAYEYYGKKCLELFEGIFAFAIWDKQKKELFLARDQFGVKPLFYYFDGNRFIFSSEIKGILEHDIAREIDEAALNTFFRMLYINGPCTILKNIYKLDPATYLLYKNGKIEKANYFEIKDYHNLLDRKEAIGKIKTQLGQSVREQMVADVPVGVFLSGGIDSSIILGLAKEVNPKKIKTFSVGFDLPEMFFQKFNEDYLLAKKVAKHYDTDHYDVLLKEQEIIESFEKVVWHMDDLVYSPTQVANYVLAKLASKEVKVVLGGDGGDELFGGYSRYYYYHLINYWQSIPKSARNSFLTKGIASLFGRSELLQRANMDQPDLLWSFMAQKEALLQKVLKAEFNDLAGAKTFFLGTDTVKGLLNNEQIDLVKKMMEIDRQTWLVDFSLTRSDKMSMAWGLEQRVPFLDIELLRIANSIPTRLKIGNSVQGKTILRQAMKDYIPEFIAKKKKTGWFAPASKWLRAGLKDYSYEILSSSYNNGETDRYIDFVSTRKLLDDHVAGRVYALNTLWSIITFQVWYRQFINNK